MRTISSDHRDLEVEFFIDTLCRESGVKITDHQKMHMMETVTDFFEMLDTMGLFSWDELPRALSEFTRQDSGSVSVFATRKEMRDGLN